MEAPFFSALLEFGVRDDEMGLLDRCGKRWLVFDLDGTRQTVIERAVPNDATYGAPRRRRNNATAPGYTGRRRGDAVRTRLTVQQSHSTEWLGSFSGLGNGRIDELVTPALDVIDKYLVAHNVERDHALLRFDGEHGHPVHLLRLLASGLRFVVRGAYYSWLDHPAVRASLEAGTHVRIAHPDTGVTRELFDVPVVPIGPDEAKRSVRLIITRRRHDPTQPIRVGTRRCDWIYEVFVSNTSPEAFHAADLIELYRHRGAFEATLAQEDNEVFSDAWISNHPHGEDLWQCVTQAIWNLRLSLGHKDAKTTSLRRTDFTPALTITDEPVTVLLVDEPGEPALLNEYPAISQTEHNADDTAEAALAAVEVVAVNATLDGPAPQTPTEEDASSGGALAFVRDDSGTMRCPTGRPMRLVEILRKPGRTRERWQSSESMCGRCAERASCRGAMAERAVGRRLSVAPGQARVEVLPNGRTRAPRALLPKSKKRGKVAEATRERESNVPMIAQEPDKPQARATVAPPANTHLIWCDVPATRLRSNVMRALHGLVVECQWRTGSTPSTEVDRDRLLTRDERAHRRHTRAWSQERNARGPEQAVVILRILGLPATFAACLGIS